MKPVMFICWRAFWTAAVHLPRPEDLKALRPRAAIFLLIGEHRERMGKGQVYEWLDQICDQNGETGYKTQT